MNQSTLNSRFRLEYLLLVFFLISVCLVYILPHVLYAKGAANPVERRVGILGSDCEASYLVSLGKMVHHGRLGGNPYIKEHFETGEDVFSTWSLAPYFPLRFFCRKNAFLLGRIGDAVFPPMLAIVVISCLRVLGVRWVLIFPLAAILMFNHGFFPSALRSFLSGGFDIFRFHRLPALEGYHPAYFKAFLAFSRPVSPQTNSITFFAFLLALCKAQLSEKRQTHMVWSVIAGIILGIVMRQYFYFWAYGLTLVGVLLSISVFVERNRVVGLLAIAGIAVLIGHPVLLQNLFPTIEQMDVQSRVGFGPTREIVFPPKTWWALAAWGSILSISPKKKLSKGNSIFSLGILLSAPIVLNQQLITGHSCQIGHFIELPISFGCLLLLAIFCMPFENLLDKKSWRWVLVVTTLLFIVNGFWIQLKDYYRTANTSRYMASIAQIVIHALDLIGPHEVIAMPYAAWDASAPLTGRPVFHNAGSRYSLISNNELEHRTAAQGWLYGYDLETDMDSFSNRRYEHAILNYAASRENIYATRRQYELDAILYPPSMDGAYQRVLSCFPEAEVIYIKDGWLLVKLPEIKPASS